MFTHELERDVTFATIALHSKRGSKRIIQYLVYSSHRSGLKHHFLAFPDLPPVRQRHLCHCLSIPQPSPGMGSSLTQFSLSLCHSCLALWSFTSSTHISPVGYCYGNCRLTDKVGLMQQFRETPPEQNQRKCLCLFTIVPNVGSHRSLEVTTSPATE